MRSITFKMVLAFLGLALISIILIVGLARWNTNTEFSRFVSDRLETETIEYLESYYRNNGSWEGIERSHVIQNSPRGPGSGPGRKPFFTLADGNGNTLIPGPGYRRSERIPQKDLDSGLPIIVDSNQVGTLILRPGQFEKIPREQEFLQRTQLMLIYSAFGAAVIALLIGIFLSRSLTRPIRELTEATQAVAAGELGSQVSVRSKDELGELADSFNQMSADLARSTEAREQMTADIAHELRTPLSLIIGHADAVHDGVLPPTKENFEIIREEALRLEHMVDDLRTLSLADAGELRMHFQPVSPKKLVEDLSATYKHIADRQKIELILETASELPTLNIDPGRMTQVLTNILDNALQHTPKGGQIDLSARRAGANVELSIRDSGPGIQGDDVNRIFSRFYRADEARSREDGGSGLGLAIAKSIVEAHGGRILAESQPGEGLTIIVQIPI